MKNLKMSLTAVALFAIVGGALAFTGKFSSRFCVAAYDNQSCQTQPLANPTVVTGAKDIGGTTNCFKLVDATVTSCDGVHTDTPGTITNE